MAVVSTVLKKMSWMIKSNIPLSKYIRPKVMVPYAMELLLDRFHSSIRTKSAVEYNSAISRYYQSSDPTKSLGTVSTN
jgi:hypothetical protein